MTLEASRIPSAHHPMSQSPLHTVYEAEILHNIYFKASLNMILNVSHLIMLLMTEIVMQ